MEDASACYKCAVSNLHNLEIKNEIRNESYVELLTKCFRKSILVLAIKVCDWPSECGNLVPEVPNDTRLGNMNAGRFIVRRFY